MWLFRSLNIQVENSLGDGFALVPNKELPESEPTVSVIPWCQYVYKPAEDALYAPTLSELIAACGIHSEGLPVFKQLNWHATARQTPYICQTPQGKVDMREVGAWCAKARIGKGLAGHISAWGKTAEEAVARLWLALNTK